MTFDPSAPPQGHARRRRGRARPARPRCRRLAAGRLLRQPARRARPPSTAWSIATRPDDAGARPHPRATASTTTSPATSPACSSTWPSSGCSRSRRDGALRPHHPRHAADPPGAGLPRGARPHRRLPRLAARCGSRCSRGSTTDGHLRATSHLGASGATSRRCSTGWSASSCCATWRSSSRPSARSTTASASGPRGAARCSGRPSTLFVLVTGPGEERVADTLFFARRLREAGHRLGPVVVNRVHPPADGDRPGGRARRERAAAAAPGSASATAGASRRCARWSAPATRWWRCRCCRRADRPRVAGGPGGARRPLRRPAGGGRGGPRRVAGRIAIGPSRDAPHCRRGGDPRELKA